MNVQVEHIENHIARMTVRLEAGEVLTARQKAAQRLAKQVRIPGFRPGKAPYNIVSRMIGDQNILSEAVDGLAEKTYKSALEESQLEPIAPGQLVNFKEEEAGELSLIFDIPKQPTVDLKDYRSVRMDLTIEEVTDEAVTKAMETMREERAVVEDVERPAKEGDEVELDITATFWHEEDHDHDHDEEDDDDDDDHDEEENDDDDSDEEADDDDDDKDEEDHDHEHHDHDHDHHDHEHHDHEHAHGGHVHNLIDEKNAKLVVRDAVATDDLFPGFSAEIVGLSAGETKTFSLQMPAEYENEMLAGQAVEVTVSAIHAVRSRTLPELNDLFAQTVTNNEVQTLLELRIQVRKDLEQASVSAAETKLFDEVIEKIIEQAEIQYPEVLIEVYTDGMMRAMERLLQQQFGLTLKEYTSISGRGMAEMRDQQRPNAIKRMERELVFGELVGKEGLTLTDEAISQEIDKIAQGFGEQADVYRQLLDVPNNRQDVADAIMNRRLLRRVTDIVTGKDPAIGLDPEPDQIVLLEAGDSMPLTATTEVPAEAQAEPQQDETHSDDIHQDAVHQEEVHQEEESAS